MESLNFPNFFSKYIIDPHSQKLQESDRTRALVCSIAIGILLLGIPHALVATIRCFKHRNIKPLEGDKKLSDFYQTRKALEDQYPFRARVYAQTKLIIADGGYTLPDGKKVAIDSTQLKSHTVTYQSLPELPPIATPFITEFHVIEDDTFNVMLNRMREGATNLCGINMANRYHQGGGVEDGCPAQEEALCRCSNLIEGLKTQNYPMPEHGVIYSPEVTIFREYGNGDKGYRALEQPQQVAMVSIAAYDLRLTSRDRSDLKLPNAISPADLLKHEEFSRGTKAKIRQMLRAMALNHHEEIVLGALGCGAFQTPPEAMAALFGEVLSESEFKGRFKRVTFAILNLFPKDHENIEAFKKICVQLNG